MDARLGRRALLRAAGVLGGSLALSTAGSALAQSPPSSAGSGEYQEATAAEPWRRLIPRVPSPPTLPARTPPGQRPDPAAIVQLCRLTAAGLARRDGWVMP